MPDCSDVRIGLVTSYIKHHAGGRHVHSTATSSNTAFLGFLKGCKQHAVMAHVHLPELRMPMPAPRVHWLTIVPVP